MRKYDIFISYRREDGSVAARSLHDRLKRDGYKVFLDVESMTRCEFDKELKRIIQSCKDFIFILSKKALSPNTSQEDWVREELAYALENKKNIIPIFLPDFEGFPQNLPDNISSVKTINGLEYNHKHYKLYYNSLKDDFLISKPRSHKIAIGLGVLLVISLVAVVAYFFLPSKENEKACAEVKEYQDSLTVCLERYPHQEFLVFIKVDGGEYMMGIDSVKRIIREEGNEKRRKDESPKHMVRLDTFWIMEAEVIEGAWRLLTHELNHSKHDPDIPRYGLNYDDCTKFIKLLNEITRDKRPHGLVFRLPTEAEWEYAAQGGVHKDAYKYSGSDTLQSVTSMNNEGKILSIVKSKRANSLGIYDMSGSLYEWCWDWYGEKYYDSCLIKGAVENPTGPISGEEKIIRGGAYNSKNTHCEVLNRSGRLPKGDERGYEDCGFRIVLGKPLKKH